MIYAVLYPKEDGQELGTYYHAYAIDTNDQSIAQNFLCSVFAKDYFLYEESQFDAGPQEHLKYIGDSWVSETSVKVTGSRYCPTFIIDADTEI